MNDGDLSHLPLPHDEIRARKFYRLLEQHFPPPDSPCNVILVTHLLPDRPLFIDALEKQAKVTVVIPKPRSICRPVRDMIARSYRVRDDITRTELTKPEVSCRFFEEASQGTPTVILDIGGYFAPCVHEIHTRFPDTLIGVVEDTENGHQKYAKLPNLPVPVLSVARSPLKEAEDHLTGESIIFSAERLIRTHGEMLYGRPAAVFGYGKIGRSIARTLHSRGVRVSVVDTNPIRSADAMAHGFSALTKQEALARCDLIFAATGNLSLSDGDFDSLPNGSFIASVTSSDDELDLNDLPGSYQIKRLGEAVTCYEQPGHYFYLLNDGNAVNFLDRAALGPYLHLVQGEILASRWAIHSRQKCLKPRITSINSNTRQKIARSWLDVFNPRAG